MRVSGTQMAVWKRSDDLIEVTPRLVRKFRRTFGDLMIQSSLVKLTSMFVGDQPARLLSLFCKVGRLQFPIVNPSDDRVLASLPQFGEFRGSIGGLVQRDLVLVGARSRFTPTKNSMQLPDSCPTVRQARWVLIE